MNTSFQRIFVATPEPRASEGDRERSKPPLPLLGHIRDLTRSFQVDAGTALVIRRWLVAALTIRGGLRSDQVAALADETMQAVQKVERRGPPLQTHRIVVLVSGGELGVRVESEGGGPGQVIRL